MFRLLLLLFFVPTPPAFGQIFALELLDEKLFSKNPKLTVELDGENVFLVEAGVGVAWKSEESRVV